MKLSDYVIKKISDIGVKHVFMLAGGGAMHLNDSLGRSKYLQHVCNLHEQACAIAAESYGQYTNNLGVCMVTTGPGSTNTLTGVAAGWMDSTPMLIISGQVKRDDLCHGLGVRQMGFQEINIIPIVETITKYAVTIKDPESIRYHMEKAIWSSQEGRPGPSWVDIPLDVQAKIIDPHKLISFSASREGLLKKKNKKILSKDVSRFLDLIKESEKPIILIGNGIRLAKAESKVNSMVKKLKIPFLTTWKAMDLFQENNPLFIGRPGAIGQRAANIAQQNSDLLIMIGARMDMGQTAFMHQYLAPKAKKVMVDIDKYEINKMKMEIDLPIVISADLFIEEVLFQLSKNKVDGQKFSSWHRQCIDWKKKFPVVIDEYWNYEDGVSLYALVEAISKIVKPGHLFIPGSSGACSEVSMQAFKVKKGVRVFNSEGMGPMGFGISAALGGCLASNKKRTICIDGDGGFSMNTQELETIRRLNLPISFFVLDNKGYSSIRSTQKSYFNSRYIGSSEQGGVTLPNLKKISRAYDIRYFQIKDNNSIIKVLKMIFEIKTPVICRVSISENQVTAPRVITKKNNDGTMETAPMEIMWPPVK